MEKAESVGRNEREIAGYRDVLAAIHEAYDAIPIAPNIILQLHRNLYAYQAKGFGGTWKNGDNIIAETNADGTMRVRFRPVSALATPDAMRSLCDAYRAGIDAGVHDPLLLAIMFVFDFLCIHPFDDGNGRMSRLLTLLLLCRQGYVVGKYISLEMLVEKNKETYYETLQASSIGWDENRNDLFPFLRYLLGVILRAYREFAERMEARGDRSMGKAERIRKFVTTHLGDVSKAQIAAEFPDVSITLIEKTLKGLLDDGLIEKKAAVAEPPTGYARRGIESACPQGKFRFPLANRATRIIL